MRKLPYNIRFVRRMKIYQLAVENGDSTFINRIHLPRSSVTTKLMMTRVHFNTCDLIPS